MLTTKATINQTIRNKPNSEIVQSVTWMKALFIQVYDPVMAKMGKTVILKLLTWLMRRWKSE